jgi:hypothetical protein
MRLIICLSLVSLLLLSVPGIAQPTEVQTDQAQPAEGPTDYAALDRFIREYTEQVDGGNGRWAFEIGGVTVMVLADQAADRMRLMTPVAEVVDFEDGEYQRLMEANYDRALDARYAISDGVLWSAFIHPMSSLSHEEFDDGLEQVVNLADNFGTSYASSDMQFAPGAQQPDAGETPRQREEPATPRGQGAPPAPRH